MMIQNKTINIYEAHVMTKEGAVVYRDCRAPDRREAARMMRCHDDDVRCVRANVRRTIDEIIIHHTATQAPATFRPHLCRVKKDDTAFRHSGKKGGGKKGGGKKGGGKKGAKK